MTHTLDVINALTIQYQGSGYYSGGGDVNQDGVQDRAEPKPLDGNGVDCSGWQWFVMHNVRTGHGGDLFPLSSTAGYAYMAQDRGWWVNHQNVRPGDFALYSSNGDVFASGGPGGHGGIVVEANPATGYCKTSESYGGYGPGFRSRGLWWWDRYFRVPGFIDTTEPARPLTPEEWAAFKRALEELSVEHGMAADTQWLAGDRLVTLDRWGGLHANHGIALRYGKGRPDAWVGYDVCRKLVINPLCFTDSTAPIRGYVQDLDGGLHGFAEKGAPAPANTSVGYWSGGKILAFNEL